MDQVTLVKNQYRLEQWTKLIQECQSSGMKVDDWCAANDISHHAYYYWLRKIRQTACAELTVTSTNPVTEFKQLEVVAPKTDTVGAILSNHCLSVCRHSFSKLLGA